MSTSNDTFTTPFDFTFEKVIITADRFDFEVNLTYMISEINMFEHVDKPYLTGTILFNDNANLYNEINWLGTEKVEITIKTDDKLADHQITKKFRVVRIAQAVKANDQNEMFLLDLVEDHAYESRLKNVQQSYQGYHHEIIEKILKDHLNRELMYVPKTGFKKIRAIVPNMTPLDAANWIKDGTPDAFGSPYFLYSTIADDKIRFIDLETILNLPPINKKTPYIFNQAFGPKTDATEQSGGTLDDSYIIQAYKTSNTEDVLKLVRNGYVGSTWNFFDLYKGDQYEVKHDITKVYDSMIARNVFREPQVDPVFDEDANIHHQSSREINQIATSRVYSDWENFKSYHEDEEAALHEQKVKQKALRHFLLKAPIDINVPGKNFLLKDKNLTIGNIIDVEFHINDDMFLDIERDNKRSGQYFVYAARHVFTANRYTVNLMCAKMAQSRGVEKT